MGPWGAFPAGDVWGESATHEPMARPSPRNLTDDRAKAPGRCVRSTAAVPQPLLPSKARNDFRMNHEVYTEEKEYGTTGRSKVEFFNKVEYVTVDLTYKANIATLAYIRNVYGLGSNN